MLKCDKAANVDAGIISSNLARYPEKRVGLLCTEYTGRYLQGIL